MRKIIILCFILLCCIAQIVHAESTYTCGRGSSVTTTNSSCSYNTSRPLYITEKAYYDTQEEAYAAAVQGWATMKATYTTYNGSSFNNYGNSAQTGVNPTIWGAWSANVSKCSSGAGNQWIYQWIYYYRLSSWVDVDNDCAMDEETDCSGKYYQILEQTKDETSGDILHAVIQTSDGGYRQYGDPNAFNDCLKNSTNCTKTTNDAVKIDPETNQGIFNINNSLCNVETALGLTPTPEGQKNNETATLPSGEKGTDGQAGDPSDTQAQALDKIADNTKMTADNTSGLQDSANGIEAQLKLANQKLDQINNNDVAGEPSANALNKKAQLDNTQDDDPSDAESYGFVSSDAGPPTVIGDILDGIKQQNPLTPFLSKLQVDADEEECSIDEEVIWNNGLSSFMVHISFCEYEQWVDLMGMILYICTAIYFIFLIFG